MTPQQKIEQQTIDAIHREGVYTHVIIEDGIVSAYKIGEPRFFDPVTGKGGRQMIGML